MTKMKSMDIKSKLLGPGPVSYSDYWDNSKPALPWNYLYNFY